MADTTYTHTIPFLTDDPMFARGVEMGILYQRMYEGAYIIDTWIHTENQDQVIVLANHLKYEFKFYPVCQGWMGVTLRQQK